MRPGCKSRRMQTIGTSFHIMSLQERHLQTCREVAANASVFDWRYCVSIATAANTSCKGFRPAIWVRAHAVQAPSVYTVGFVNTQRSSIIIPIWSDYCCCHQYYYHHCYYQLPFRFRMLLFVYVLSTIINGIVLVNWFYVALCIGVSVPVGGVPDQQQGVGNTKLGHHPQRCLCHELHR